MRCKARTSTAAPDLRAASQNPRRKISLKAPQPGFNADTVTAPFADSDFAAPYTRADDALIGACHVEVAHVDTVLELMDASPDEKDREKARPLQR
jgi:hypothetical protein